MHRLLNFVFKRINQHDFIWQIDVPFTYTSDDNQAIHVDIGAGRNPRNPFSANHVVALDIISPGEVTDEFWDPRVNRETVRHIRHDFTRGLPFEEGEIDSFSAFDVLEHVPRWERIDGEIHFPFVELMSEIYRCLKPKGKFIAVTPAYPSFGAFVDPTHVNFISRETVYIFGVKDSGENVVPMYGYRGKFLVLHNDWLIGGGPSLVRSEGVDFSSRRRWEKTLILLKYLKRLLKMKLNFSKRTHLLWVLEKC